jgi:uncharacterized protein (TIGR02453 family)
MPPGDGWHHEEVAFRGWPAEALDFYDGLEADNTKAYWQDHKALYERAVRAPMDALLAELEAEFGAGKIFRPYRDVRFSADKTPYKTHIGATLAGGGYIELSTEGLAAGCGYWHLAPDQLTRFREAVDDDRLGDELVALLAGLQATGIGTIARSELKTAPRGYPKDHPRIELLRRKGLATWRRWPVAPWLGTAKAKDRVIEFLRASRPVQQWLDTHVGPSTAPPDARRR